MLSGQASSMNAIGGSGRLADGAADALQGVPHDRVCGRRVVAGLAVPVRESGGTLADELGFRERHLSEPTL